MSEIKIKIIIETEIKQECFIPKNGDIICVTTSMGNYIEKFRKYEGNMLTYYGQIRISDDKFSQPIGNLCNIKDIIKIRLANDSEKLKYYINMDNDIYFAKKLNQMEKNIKL